MNLPLVIAHRGASGELPEHTLAAYERAIAQGADFIEPDLVPTRDGVLIARHEPNLSFTTDVAAHPEFRDRYTTQTIDGMVQSGYFAHDFTLAEIKTLRAVMRQPFRTAAFNGQFDIPTCSEVIELVQRVERTTGRAVGLYPETKHPTFFAQQGRHQDGTPIHINLGAELVTLLVAHGFTDPDRIFIQSFEAGNLQELQQVLLPQAELTLPLIQLWCDQPPPTPALCAQIARYAAGIGVPKQLIVPVADGHRLPPTPLLTTAQASGLQVHAYTFRDEPQFLAPDYAGNSAAEYEQFFELGIDGVFTDFPASAIAARQQWDRRSSGAAG